MAPEQPNFIESMQKLFSLEGADVKDVVRQHIKETAKDKGKLEQRIMDLLGKRAATLEPKVSLRPNEVNPAKPLIVISILPDYPFQDIGSAALAARAAPLKSMKFGGALVGEFSRLGKDHWEKFLEDEFPVSIKEEEKKEYQYPSESLPMEPRWYERMYKNMKTMWKATIRRSTEPLTLEQLVAKKAAIDAFFKKIDDMKNLPGAMWKIGRALGR